MIGTVVGGVIADVAFQVVVDADGDFAIPGVGGSFRFESKAVVLQAQSTLREPGMFGHFDNQLDFGLADGLFVLHELVQEGVEIFLAFYFFENAEAGAQTMLDWILRDFGLGLSGLGARGFLCVAAIGRDLLGSRHGDETRRIRAHARRRCAFRAR